MKKPRHKIVPLGQSKKKPSALLVYLALESAGRLKPMNREDIVKYINDNYGVHIEPKTVTEASSVLKSLSSGPKPIIDFHSHGKSGYLLGSTKSPLSQEEIVRLLTCFSTISSDAAERAFEGLLPYMSKWDAEMVQKIQGRLPKVESHQERNSMDYFAKLRIILDAFDQQKEVVFDHRYVDAKGVAVQEEENVAIVPYYLFEKNGRFYLMGGRMGGLKSPDGTKSCLYIADTENMHGVHVGEEEAEDLPITDCVNGKNFDLTRYLGQIYFVREGVFHPASEKGYLAEINTEAAYLLTKQMYGDCVEDVEQKILQPATKTMPERVHYTVRLHLDWPALIMWSLYFAWQGKLLLDESQIETKFLLPTLGGHAGKAYDQYVESYNRKQQDAKNERSSKAIQKYGPKPKLPAEAKKND